MAASKNQNNVRLSKSLSWMLRHGALKEGIQIDHEGYVDVEMLIRHRNFVGVSLSEILSVVDGNDKKRFTIVKDDLNGKWKIKANQGHTLQVNDLELKQININEAENEFPTIIHGTYPKSWKEIEASGGLSKMKRNHIHFSPGEPGDDKVISGMRASASVWIYINMAAAIRDGFEFFLSPNNVVLTPGDPSGFLPIRYFKRVIRKTRGGNITLLEQ